MLDTGFFIASLMEDDTYHERLPDLFKEMRATGETLVLTESILGEVATFLKRKEDAKNASEKALQILHSPSWLVIAAKESEIREALVILGQYGFSSYADALSISVMKSRGIKKIVSFDSEFDRVPGIKRIH